LMRAAIESYARALRRERISALGVGPHAVHAAARWRRPLMRAAIESHARALRRERINSVGVDRTLYMRPRVGEDR